MPDRALYSVSLRTYIIADSDFIIFMLMLFGCRALHSFFLLDLNAKKVPLIRRSA